MTAPRALAGSALRACSGWALVATSALAGPACAKDEPILYPQTPPAAAAHPQPYGAPPYGAAPPGQPHGAEPSGNPTPGAPGSTAAGQAHPETLGDAMAPFGIVLPENISLMKLPPPGAWPAWPFTWSNQPAAGTPAAPGQPAPSQPAPATPTPTPAAPAPSAPPATSGSRTGWLPSELQVVHEVNRRRASGASCGGQAMPPAPPVQPNDALQRAARAHSVDMAQNDYFEHTSLDGRRPVERTRAAGYPSDFVGENIAAGRDTAAGTVDQWMASPGHCLNIMEPKYRFLGVGYAQNPSTRLTHFWTQNFGG